MDDSEMFLARAKQKHQFAQRLAAIATKHRDKRKQRRAVADLIREMPEMGSPEVLAGLLQGAGLPKQLNEKHQNIWAAYEFYRLDGLGYEDAVQRLSDEFHLSNKGIESAVQRAKRAGRELR